MCEKPEHPADKDSIVEKQIVPAGKKPRVRAWIWWTAIAGALAFLAQYLESFDRRFLVPSLVFVLLAFICSARALWIQLVNNGATRRNAHTKSTVVIGLGLVFCGVLYCWELQQPPNSVTVQNANTFSIGKGPAIIGTYPIFWCVRVVDVINNEVVAYPIRTAIFIQLTNLKSISCMVNAYSLQIDYGDGNWKDTTTIDVRDGELFFAPTDLKKAGKIDRTEDIFDSKIENKNFLPGETVQGWIFIKEGFGPKFRFRIKDSTKAVSVAAFDLSRPDTNTLSVQILRCGFKFFGGFSDISEFPQAP